MDGGTVGELLGGPPLNIGAGALVTLIVLLVLTGRLVTLRELRDAQQQRDKAMELAETWQKVATEHGMTLVRILDYAETSNHALTEISAVVVRPPEKKP